MIPFLTPVQINSIPTPLLAWKTGGGSPPVFNAGIELEDDSGLILLEDGVSFIQLES
jgi:hypothetical protein